MKYIKYVSKGNSQGLEQDIESYWELDKDGYTTRSVEVIGNGKLLKYSEEHAADEYGQLPEGETTQENLSDASYGKCIELSKGQFESIWLKEAINVTIKT